MGTVENLLNASKLFAVSECLNEMRMLMNINIILNFKGNCKEKVAKLSGGKVSTLGKGGGERIHLSLSGFDIRFLHSLDFNSPPQILGFKHFQTGSHILLAHS